MNKFFFPVLWAVLCFSPLCLQAQVEMQGASAVSPVAEDVSLQFKTEGTDSVKVNFKLKFKHHKDLKYVMIRVGSEEGSGNLLSEDLEYTSQKKIYKGSKELVLTQEEIPLQKISSVPSSQAVYVLIKGYDARMNVLYTISKTVQR